MKTKRYFNTNLIRNSLLAFSIFVLVIFSYVFFVNYIVFHTIIEFSIMVLGIIASTVGVFTSFKLKDNILSRISPSLFVYTTFIFIHIMSYAGITIYSGDNVSLSASAWIIANSILALGFLFSIIDSKGNLKVPTRLVMSFCFGILFYFLALLDILPPAILEGNVTLVFRILQYIVIFIFALAVLTFLLKKHLRKKQPYRSILYALVFLFVSEILLLNHFESEGFVVFLGLIFRFGGFMIIMYGVFSINLVEPYNKLYQSLLKDNILQKKLVIENEVSISRLARSQEIGHVGTWELNIKTNDVWASNEAFRIYGIKVTTDNILPINIAQNMVNSDDRPRLDLALLNLIQKNSDYNVYFSITNKNGEYRYIQSVATLKYIDGSPAYVYGVLNDITSLKLEQDKLRYASYHDHLTNVYNRRYFMEQRSALNFPKYYPISSVILDINGLKVINDSFGHHTGNSVLKKTAETLSENTVKEHSFVSRIGGDEFAIIFPNTPLDEAELLVQDLVHKVTEERVGNINLSIAYGLAALKDNSMSFEDVLKNAEDDMYLHKISDSQSVRNKMIDALLKTLYEKDTVSEQHSQRVSTLSYDLAKALKFSNKKASDIKVAGSLHDIGKITIANRILNKKGRLTDAEYEIIKIHPEKGYKIIHSIGGMDIIANIVLQHHERIDGKGYPKGLKGEDISLEAKIIGIVDAYDAMTSYRSYKDKMSQDQAINELVRCKGTQFDSKLVDVFVNDVLKKV